VKGNMKVKARCVEVLLIVTFLLTACTDQDLTTVAKALDDTSKGVAIFQTTVIQANGALLISDDTTRILLNAAVRVNAAGQQAVTVTRNLNALAPADRTNLLAILSPVIAALAETQTEITIGIHDPQTQTNIRAALLLIQTSLNTAQLVLSSRG